MSFSPSRNQIWRMFDAISPTYDRVNRIMTTGFDRYWRNQLARFLPHCSHINLLDVATGTGDQIISLLKRAPQIERAMGIDLAQEMLRIAQLKIAPFPFSHKVAFQEGDALHLPFSDASFECVTMTFGIRNVTDVDVCLKEIHRVLKPGGRALILEATLPSHPLARRGHLVYLRHVLPRIGGWLSKNREAYRYLNQTIETFPSGEAFCTLLSQAGFISTLARPLTLGTVTLYQGDKG